RRMTTRFSKRINGQYRTVATLFAMYGRDVLTDNVSKTYKLLHIMYHGYFPDFIQRVIKHKVDVSRMEWDDVIKEVTGEHGPLKRIK
ncbi:MAG: hypothetical protein ACRDDY_00715, partial [Clostridium sp.]|uniref:hypothetical protein n=1 Tax=Clostridium sp. TaxID=1506 RepID=UPI003EE46FE4